MRVGFFKSQSLGELIAVNANLFYGDKFIDREREFSPAFFRFCGYYVIFLFVVISYENIYVFFEDLRKRKKTKMKITAV